MCIEQSEQWQTGYRYLDMSLINKTKVTKKEKQNKLKKAG